MSEVLKGIYDTLSVAEDEKRVYTEESVADIIKKYENELRKQKLDNLAQIKETKKYKKLYENTRSEVKQLKQKQYEYNIERDTKDKHTISVETELETIRAEKLRLEVDLNKKVNKLEKSLSTVIASKKSYRDKVDKLHKELYLLKEKLRKYKEEIKRYSKQKANCEPKVYTRQVSKMRVKLSQRDSEIEVLRNKLSSISKCNIQETPSSIQFKEQIGYVDNKQFISDEKQFRLINVHEGGVYKAYTIGNLALPVKEFRVNSIHHKTVRHKKQANISSEPLDILKFANYKVLIIGERNKDLYKRGLAKCGLQVDMISSYEYNVVRIKNMLNQYDIVICLIDHARHYAVNLMKYMQTVESDNNCKYTVVKDDKLDKLILHINFVIENLNSERKIVNNE